MVRKQARADLSLIEFVRPGGSWPYPYSVEQAFELVRAMVATGRRYSLPGRWGKSGVLELLCGGGVVNCSALRPISSLGDLNACLHRALLGVANTAVEQWRKREHFTLTGRHTLTVPHYRALQRCPFQGQQVAEHEIGVALTQYFSQIAGRQLAVSLNSVHLTARRVVQALVDVGPDSFRFRLEYGLNGSVWSCTLARTQAGESFLDTFNRAWSRYRLLTGEAEPDPARLAHRLNEDEQTGPGSTRTHGDPPVCWVAGRRPIQGHPVEMTERFALVPLGHRPSLNLVHRASGRLLLTRRAGAWTDGWTTTRRPAGQLEATGCGHSEPPSHETVQAAARAAGKADPKGMQNAHHRG